MPLPLVNDLPRPEFLYAQSPPYHIFVRASNQMISVQGSHQPSLELLQDYLKKWTNTMRTDNRRIPILDIELQESHFGLDGLFDELTIKPANTQQTWYGVNPVLVVAFIEGILKYQMGPQLISDTMYFKRREAFN